MLVAVMPMNVFAEGDTPAPGDEQPVVTAGDGDGDVTGDQEETPEQKLAKAKEKAVATVDKLSDLSEANKEAAKQAINNATDEDGVKTELQKAQALNDAKAQAKEDVKDLANKDEAIKAIEDASDINAVTTAVTKAQEADKKAKEEEKKKAAELEEEKAKAKEEVDKLANLSDKEKEAAKKAIDDATDKAGVDKALNEAKTKNDAKKPDTKPDYYKVDVYSYAHGSAKVNTSLAKAGDTITVTATPNYGYAVKRVYYIDKKGEHTIKNYAYNDYYYYGYNGRYYNGYYGDYYRYYSDYEKNYYYDYSSYDAYLKDRHYSFWNNGYRYWDDYDYKYYNRYYDRYYDGYYSDYYRYYDDYVDNYYRRYSSYEDYLKAKHYSHYYDYRYYDKYDYRYYDYRYYNYTTTDTFTMPASDVTVYVEFTDWAYYGYYYDDYYYYRYHRNKKDNYYERQKKAEEKAEEEKVVEKTPQVFEASATINVGSNVFTKVNKNVTTKHQMDVAAYVKNGRVMLPLRYVAEALGLQVSWVPETKTVIIWDLTQRVEIPIKSNKIIVNGVTYTSDVKPEINSSRTMLPIANIARALGLVDGSDIIWDPVLKQVKLTRRVISK